MPCIRRCAHLAASITRAAAMPGRRLTIRFDNTQLKSIEKGVAMADVLAPLAGKILAVLVEPGSKVDEDDELIVIEALKMENTVYAPSAGTVKEIKVKIGDSVEDEDLLLVLV
jgi:acetyl-CoA carboxylase biotin carboxyl carrier protein